MPETTPVHVRFCRRCRYELVGIEPDEAGHANCPECGRDFQPHDFRTTAPESRPALWRIIVSRAAIYTAIALLVVVALSRTWLPRPHITADGAFEWTVWIWLDDAWGVESVPAADADGSPLNVRVTWRAGRIAAARAVSLSDVNNPRQIWRLARHDDQFTLQLNHPENADWRRIIYFFNSMRTDDELFGVRIEEANPPKDDAAAITARGPKQDILAALIRTYDMTITPIEPPNGEPVWVWNVERMTLENITPGDAADRGIELIERPARETAVARHAWN